MTAKVKLIMILLCYVVFSMSCNGQGKPTIKGAVADSLSTNERPWLEEFALSYNQDLKEDSSGLIFHYTHSFDTAIVLQLKNRSTYISCIYYWVTPQNRLALKEVRNQANGLTKFEGLSGKLDIGLWNKVIQEIKQKGLNTKEEPGYLGCCDKPYYFLSYNGQSYFNNSRLNEEQLKDLKEYFKKTIIADLTFMTGSGK